MDATEHEIAFVEKGVFCRCVFFEAVAVRVDADDHMQVRGIMLASTSPYVPPFEPPAIKLCTGRRLFVGTEQRDPQADALKAPHQHRMRREP